MNIKHRNEIDSLNPYVPGRPIDDVKKEFNLTDVVKIASNENPYGCSEHVKDAVIQSMLSPQLYPDGNCTGLRSALSKFYNVAENQLIFGCGTDEVIAMLGKVFINPGDECITAETTFSQYAASVISMGGKMVYTKMKEYGFDFNEILKSITDKTKIIFIANPNNPTGTVHTNKEQEDFIKKVPSNILIVFDEAYKEYSNLDDFPKTLEHMKTYKNIMLLKTFSKAYGLASFRVGFGIAEPNIISLFEKIRPPFNVTVQAQVAAIEALKDREFLNNTVVNNNLVREYMTSFFKELDLYFIPSHANFIMVDTKIDSKILFKQLMEKGFIIRPGSAFKMDTFLRISLGTLDEMKAFAKVLKSLIER